jgi:metal-dependent amidase/aminoacylase/carboxypeptidase family protein
MGIPVGSCPFHNPHYDFNDEALPFGASLFARLVEKKVIFSRYAALKHHML